LGVQFKVLGFSISAEAENLHYGHHTINMFLPDEIYLGRDPVNGTDPNDVEFTIFNGVGADSWEL